MEDFDLQLTSYGRTLLTAATQRAEREDIPWGLALFRTVREENAKAERAQRVLPPLITRREL